MFIQELQQLSLLSINLPTIFQEPEATSSNTVFCQTNYKPLQRPNKFSLQLYKMEKSKRKSSHVEKQNQRMCGAFAEENDITINQLSKSIIKTVFPTLSVINTVYTVAISNRLYCMLRSLESMCKTYYIFDITILYIQSQVPNTHMYNNTNICM